MNGREISTNRREGNGIDELRSRNTALDVIDVLRSSSTARRCVGMGGSVFNDHTYFGSQVGRPLGAGMDFCKHYYGLHGGKHGWEHSWAESNCTYPFNDVCLMIKGGAELQPHVFETRYLRSCYFRCPCNESIPWELRGIGASFGEATNFTWHKKCNMLPDKAYALSSPAYPWPAQKKVDIYCCKKYHYPNIVADRRWIYQARGEACNIWEIDPAIRTEANIALSAVLMVWSCWLMTSDRYTEFLQHCCCCCLIWWTMIYIGSNSSHW